MATTSPTNWGELVAEKRRTLASKIPAEWRLPERILSQINQDADLSVLAIPGDCGILTKSDLSITGIEDATALRDKIASGEWTSEDVCQAFCKRAAIAQQTTNCLTEIMFDSALERARQLDAYLAKEGKPIGPLHGVPISLKDSFNVPNVHTTLGYISFLTHPAKSEDEASALVKLLTSLGAVFHCKTNLPQTLMTADSNNNVFGRTLNPRNLRLTAGGSSGGEGALIGMRGSILGVGTDIAGSIRIPAFCNGSYGFRPTADRVPFGGQAMPVRDGSPGSIHPVAGPQAVSVRDMKLFLEAVIGAEPWRFDSDAVNVPWRNIGEARTPLKIGVLVEDEAYRVHPTIMRVMVTAANELRGTGHQIVFLDKDISKLHQAAVLAYHIIDLDPRPTVVDFLKAGEEELIQSVRNFTAFPELQGYKPTLDSLFETTMEYKALATRWRDIFVQNDFDAILLPCYERPAPPHDTYGPPPYTVLANVLNYPAVQLPYLQGDEELDKPFIRPDVSYAYPYDPKLAQGIPGGFQVLGKPMRDEELQKVVEVIAESLKL